MRPPRLRSIPTRIYLGFATVLVLFVGVATISLLQHRQTTARLRLLSEGYLPLSQALSEARATQGAFATMVDRTFEGDDDAATLQWLAFARRVRPITLRRALDALGRAERLASQGRDAQVLHKLKGDLEEILLQYELANDDLESLASSLSNRDRPSTAAALTSMRQREQQIQGALAGAWSVVRERITLTSRTAEQSERQAIGLVAGLGLVALAVGLFVTWGSQRLLAPLPRLQERVAAVARGDLSARSEPHRDDEIGQVAAEFERMVNALAARDLRLREAHEAIRRAERLAAIGKLAAHVNHEIRNPLNSMRLNVELLEEDLADAPDEARQVLASVSHEVERLTAITEQYLRLARVPDPALEPGQLRPVVDELLRFLGPEMQRAGIEVQLTSASLPEVQMDQDQLRQALLNLLRNAREAMPEGGTVQLRLLADADGAVIEIDDAGSGIAEADRDNIFDLFFTTKQHGTGLGLPLTQQIVVAHGGTIRCQPSERGGTCFRVWLPARHEKPSPGEAA